MEHKSNKQRGFWSIWRSTIWEAFKESLEPFEKIGSLFAILAGAIAAAYIAHRITQEWGDYMIYWSIAVPFAVWCVCFVWHLIKIPAEQMSLEQRKYQNRVRLIYAFIGIVLFGVIVIIRGPKRTSEEAGLPSQHWLLHLKVTSIKRAMANPPQKFFFYRLVMDVNDQTFSFPLRDLFLNYGTPFEEPEALIGPPPYHIRFTAMVYDVNGDRSKPIKTIFSHPDEQTILANQLPAFGITNSIMDVQTTANTTEIHVVYDIKPD